MAAFLVGMPFRVLTDAVVQMTVPIASLVNSLPLDTGTYKFDLEFN